MINPKINPLSQAAKNMMNDRLPHGMDDSAMRQQENAVDRAVGSAIRQRRVSRGFSQERLGAAVGLTFQQIQKYERGSNRISASRLASIAKVLGADPADILGEALAEAESVARPAEADNSRGSLAVISYYRHLDEKTQASVRNLLASLAACE